MSLKHPFQTHSSVPLAKAFDSPFCNTPAVIAQEAALAMQVRLDAMDWQGHDFFAAAKGQIFGVLVVQDGSGALSCLHGFSGQLAGKWLWPGFVPPAFDLQQREGFLPAAEQSLQATDQRLTELQQDPRCRSARQSLRDTEQALSEQTRVLHTSLVERKAARRVAREQADEAALALLLRQGEADARRRADNKRQVRQQIQPIAAEVAHYEQQIEACQALLQSQRADLSACLLGGYKLLNARGEQLDLPSLIGDREHLHGVGDCAGPKLLSYAYQNGLKPVALAEFWWGAEPVDEVRHHRHFYPSCRGRCGPLLAFMLQGLPAGRQPAHLQPFDDDAAPEIVYQDKHLILVNKPAELLSVPGLATVDSVQSRLQQRYPDLPELQLVHRLDQSTSGLLLLAKTRRDHKALQRQFTGRSIRKEYIALIEGEVVAEHGEIDLPLRVDLQDRPRQLVCRRHGKPALTHWRVIGREEGLTRVALSPVTGRTHQLRVHMAHALGLSAPIVGDEIYGRPGGRLHLHAQSLEFIHPGSGERVSFHLPAPF